MCIYGKMEERHGRPNGELIFMHNVTPKSAFSLRQRNTKIRDRNSVHLSESRAKVPEHRQPLRNPSFERLLHKYAPKCECTMNYDNLIINYPGYETDRTCVPTILRNSDLLRARE